MFVLTSCFSTAAKSRRAQPQLLNPASISSTPPERSVRRSCGSRSTSSTGRHPRGRLYSLPSFSTISGRSAHRLSARGEFFSAKSMAPFQGCKFGSSGVITIQILFFRYARFFIVYRLLRAHGYVGETSLLQVKCGSLYKVQLSSVQKVQLISGNV